MLEVFQQLQQQLLAHSLGAQRTCRGSSTSNKCPNRHATAWRLRWRGQRCSHPCQHLTRLQKQLLRKHVAMQQAGRLATQQWGAVEQD